MKKLLFTLAFVAATYIGGHAQGNDFGNIARYAKDNAELLQQPNNGHRVVFMGNSITENWMWRHAEFFHTNHYICRGISGQDTYQMLYRFREDVVNLKPRVVVINGGTNDIAENNCPYNEDRTFGNIVSMVEIAQANGIKVVIASVLPTNHFRWKPQVTGVADKIASLNARLEAYAKKHKIAFANYYAALVYGPNRELRPELGEDGVHPIQKGYLVMEPIVQEAIKRAK